MQAYCAQLLTVRDTVRDPWYTVPDMDWKIELVAIPVTDVDRAKAFYVDRVGFHADHDHQVSDALRFVQLTPPGSACSIVLGTGITQMPPGSQQGVQCVVADVEAARQQLIAQGVQASDVDVQPWGSFVTSAIPTATPGRFSNCRSGSRSTGDVEDPGTRRARSRVLGRCPEGRPLP